MARFEEAVDRLYRVPLSAFAAERRALAKALPAQAAAIGALQKPTLAAWALNQLYWTRRKTIDQVVKAAERVRDLQLRRLAGKAADLDAAEDARRAALARALVEVSELLTQHGQQTSAATLDAVRETLETLPWRTLDGRLTRPLKPTGLEAIAALTQSGIASRPLAPVVPIRRPTPASVPDQSAAEKDRAAQAKLSAEIEALERELREARAAEHRVRGLAGKAAGALRRAEADRVSAEAALERASAALDARRREAREADHAVERASRARETIEAQLTEKKGAARPGRSSR